MNSSLRFRRYVSLRSSFISSEMNQNHVQVIRLLFSERDRKVRFETIDLIKVIVESIDDDDGGNGEDEDHEQRKLSEKLSNK